MTKWISLNPALIVLYNEVAKSCKVELKADKKRLKDSEKEEELIQVTGKVADLTTFSEKTGLRYSPIQFN